VSLGTNGCDGRLNVVGTFVSTLPGVAPPTVDLLGGICGYQLSGLGRVTWRVREGVLGMKEGWVASTFLRYLFLPENENGRGTRVSPRMPTDQLVRGAKEGGAGGI